MIALQFDCYYLISTEFKLGQGLLLLISMLVCLKYWPSKRSFTNVNTWLMLMLGVLMVAGAWQASRMFKSSGFLSTLLAERVLWVYIVFYFALSRLNRHNVVSNAMIKRLLYISGGFQLFLYFAQWLLSGRVVFLHVLSGERYGTARFYFQPILLVLLFCVAFSEFLNKRNNVRNAVWMMLILAEILIVQKYRMSTVALCLAAACGVVLYKGDPSKMMKYLLIGLVAGVVLLNTTIGRDIIRSLQSRGNDNSVNGRVVWRSWAISELKARPLLGNGFVSSPESYEYGGQLVRKMFGWEFTPNDHGAMGFIYQYGLFGVAWLALLLGTQLHRAMYVRKHAKNYIYIVYLVFIVIDSYSELYWLTSNGIFALCIFMVMLDREYQDVKRGAYGLFWHPERIENAFVTNLSITKKRARLRSRIV